MKKLFCGLLLLHSQIVFSYVDCIRPVEKLWTGYDEQRIYVLYKDGHFPASMLIGDVNNDDSIVDRTYGLILAGALAGKDITFRYSEGWDGSAPSCTPKVKQKIIGAWITF